MSQHYSDPKREDDTYALPDIETFEVDASTPDDECPCASVDGAAPHDSGCFGYYWQSCFPGCLPDGEPMGPFATEAEALADAREGMED